MLSARDEKNAIGATLLFNATHYALRPWPWILIALASIVVYPMTMNPEGNQIVMRQGAQEVLNTVGETEMTFLAEGLNTWRAKAEGNEEKIAGYERLTKLIASYPDAPEIKSLAFLEYNMSDKGNTTKAKDPLAMEEIVYLHLANPDIELSKLGHDLAYPTMLRFLPPGLIGLVLASLIAAVMSTISTHLNWGSSYLVNDFYLRFMNPEANDSQLVSVGRISTIALMVFSALLALLLSNALQAFGILLQIGAGTGLIFILRWFWWRINAWSEISAMAISFLVAIYFQIIHPAAFGTSVDTGIALVLGVGITSLAWIIVTYLTKPTDFTTLKHFYEKIQPGGNGWEAVKQMGRERNEPLHDTGISGKLSLEILSMLVGCTAIYSALFAIGYWLYGTYGPAAILTVVAAGSIFWLFKLWSKIRVQ